MKHQVITIALPSLLPSSAFSFMITKASMKKEQIRGLFPSQHALYLFIKNKHACPHLHTYICQNVFFRCFLLLCSACTTYTCTREQTQHTKGQIFISPHSTAALRIGRKVIRAQSQINLKMILKSKLVFVPAANFSCRFSAVFLQSILKMAGITKFAS